MDTPQVAGLFKALGAPDVDVRLVGGCVRNAVMGLPIQDIDVATPDTPDAVMERLGAAGVKVVPTGIDHGTVTAFIDGQSFEITSLRRDTACDGRHADVAFTTDWREDAGRRDFTFNAMSLRLDGTLFDYFDGAADATAGRVRFVGAPSDRIREDYLRILRLFRFQALYGRVSIDHATMDACRTHADGLAQLSAERVQQELVKIFGAPVPAPSLEDMRTAGVLAVVLPEVGDLTRLRALLRVESAIGASPDWRRRLAACVTASSGDAAAVRLKVSTADRTRLARLTAAEPLFESATPPRLLRVALYRVGAEVVFDRLLLAWARARDPAVVDDDSRWRALLGVVETWEPKSLPVSGRDVVALGIPQGPDVGDLLAEVETWWIARDFTPSRDEVLAVLMKLAATRKR